MEEHNPLLRFLDQVEACPDAAARRQRSYAALALGPASRVADVGCGAGTAAREMAALIGPEGSVAGIDFSEALLAAASGRATRSGAGVSFRFGDATALPLADACLDGYRAERLFQHLSEPAKALGEARRVLTPGGKLVLIDQDWDGLLIDSNDLKTTRAIGRAFCDGIVNGTVGRQYHRLLSDAGFAEVRVEAEAVTTSNFEEYGFLVELFARSAEASGAVSAEVAGAWLAEQRERASRGRFFLTMVHFLGHARRGMHGGR